MAYTYHLLKKQRSNSLDISTISLMGIQMPFHTVLSNQLHKYNYAVQPFKSLLLQSYLYDCTLAKLYKLFYMYMTI